MHSGKFDAVQTAGIRSVVRPDPVQVIAVTGGKGGVGKTSVAVNLSAALAAQKHLGDATRVVAAFHNVAAHKLQTDATIDCDVLIFGDDPKDRAIVAAMTEAAGLRGVHAGPLANAVAGEALTSVLIGINRNYKVDGAGIRITGID